MKTTLTNNSTLTRGLHMPTLLALIMFLFSGSGASAAEIRAAEGQRDRNSSSTSNKMNIQIASKTFTATLFDNPTVTAFKAMLPLTLDMKELNGNEKYFNLSKDLPVDAANPGTIQAGDLMLFGSNTLVLFYKTYRTSYSYTKLGRLDDASGLAAAVGSGSVTVKFELERNDNLPRPAR